MRETILLIPEYSHEIRGSILQVTQRLLKAAARRDDIHLVVPYPAEGSRWKNWTPEKWDVPAGNIEYVPVLMDRYSELALGRVSSDWAKSSFGGRKDYSVVATMRSTSPIGIKRLFAKPMAGFFPEVVNMYLIGGIDYFKALAPDLPHEMLFHMLPSWNLLYGTQGFADQIKRRMREVFSPGFCKFIQERTVQINLGIDLEKLRTITPRAKCPGLVRMVYGGRLAAEKGVQDYIDMADKLYSEGHPIEYGFYFVFDRWGENEAKLEPYRRIYTKVRVNAEPIEEHYFAYGASADLFISTSKHEAAALGFTELLYLGVPGFFLKAPYLKGLVPDDYPFIFENKTELLHGVRAYCKLVEKADGKKPYDMSKVQRFIEEHHDRSRTERRTLDMLVALSTARREKVRHTRLCDLLPS